MYGVIYFILNKISGKYYIGQTVQDLDLRWRNHVNSSRNLKNNWYFYNAIRKYGKDCFEVRVLTKCVSKEDLDKAECYFIDLFMATNPRFGYNSKTGGANGIPGSETRKKLSKAAKGIKRGPVTKEHRESMSRVRLGKPGHRHTPESKAKISAAHKGKQKNPEAILKSANSQRGRVVPEEIRQKIRAGHLGKKRSEDHKKAISYSLKGKKRKRKMRISQVGLSLIKQEEGFSSKTYNDVAGFATVGFGHKVLPTDNFPVYGITESQAEEVLIEDCSHIEFFLESYAQQFHWTLNQNQIDCLMDFGYNLGVGSLHQLMSHGQAQIPQQILRWDHAAGKVFEPLLERREKELALWQTPNLASQSSQ